MGLKSCGALGRWRLPPPAALHLHRGSLPSVVVFGAEGVFAQKKERVCTVVWSAGACPCGQASRVLPR